MLTLFYLPVLYDFVGLIIKCFYSKLILNLLQITMGAFVLKSSVVRHVIGAFLLLFLGSSNCSICTIDQKNLIQIHIFRILIFSGIARNTLCAMHTLLVTHTHNLFVHKINPIPLQKHSHLSGKFSIMTLWQSADV